MKPYRILLFDADDTLFDFQKAEEQALDKALQMHGFPHDEAIKQDYKKINSELWQAFEKGLIDKEAIKSQRFTRLFQQYQIAYDGTLFNEEYLRYLGEGSDLLPDALAVCARLAEDFDLYLVTNGIAQTQRSRLDRSALKPYIKKMFVSEESGYQKPQKEYFTYVEARIPDFAHDQVLLIGDSLASDMMGGIHAGYDVCWFNPHHKQNEGHLPLTYEIDDLRALFDILYGSEKR